MMEVADVLPAATATVSTNLKATDPNREELAHVSTCSSSNVSLTQASSERDSEDNFADVGFLFDGNEPSTLKRFEWGTQKNGVRVALHVVDDEPGALQSGHYLWPAASALAEYMMHNQQALRQARNVLELGAGSALLSLTALQLMHDSLQCVVVTDHDPGTLERARDNYETTLEDLLEATQTEEGQFEIINGQASVPIMFESLEWGDADTAQEVATAAAEHSSPLLLEETIQVGVAGRDRDWEQEGQNPNQSKERNIFDLLFGSDLIYCEDVVKPLFNSVSYFMTPGGSFLLSQSMKYDDATEGSIDEMCQALNLCRQILKDTLRDEVGVRIQLFTWKPCKGVESTEETD